MFNGHDEAADYGKAFYWKHKSFIVYTARKQGWKAYYVDLRSWEGLNKLLRVLKDEHIPDSIPLNKHTFGAFKESVLDELKADKPL